MSKDLPLEEIVDRCVERLLEGERLDDVLASYPGRGPDLLPLLQAAGAMAGLPAPPPPPSGRGLALSRMLATVSAEARRPAPTGLLAWLRTLRARPLAFQAAALAAAVVVFAGVGIGASAATGTTPGPVRTFFRLPDDSTRSVRLSGTVVSASADTLVIRTEGGDRPVAIVAATTFRRGRASIAWSDLAAGERVDVSGTQRDARVTATQVTAQVPPTTPAGRPGSATPGGPTVAPAAAGTEDPDDNQATETPRDERTPGPDDDRDSARTPVPRATVTAAGHDGTPRATTSPERGGDDETPKPTKTPEPGDRTPGPPMTATAESGGPGGGDR